MVIKVLKPGIEDILVADLNFVYIVARILEFLNPDLSRASLVRYQSNFLQLEVFKDNYKKKECSLSIGFLIILEVGCKDGKGKLWGIVLLNF